MERETLLSTDDQVETGITVFQSNELLNNRPSFLTKEDYDLDANLPRYPVSLLSLEIDEDFIKGDFNISYTPPKHKDYKLKFRKTMQSCQDHRFPSHLGNTNAIPEHGLLVAILWRAIWDLKASSPLLRRAAYYWLHSDIKPGTVPLDLYPKARPFSYVWICQSLGLNPGLLLRQINKHITITTTV